MEKKEIRDVLIMSIAGFILSMFSIGSLFFTLPLLLLSKRYPKRSTDTACVAVLVLAVGKQLFDSRSILMNSLTYLFVGNNLFIPVSLILGAMVWVHTKGMDAFKRMLFSVLPSFVLFLILGAVYLALPENGQSVVNAYREIYTSLMSAFVDADSAVLNMTFDIMLELLLSIAIPLVFINLCTVHFIFEAGAHRFDEEFDERLSRFTAGDRFIYAFLASWTVMLIKQFVSFGEFANLLINNITLTLTLVYAVQGFAIVLYAIRRKGMKIRGSKLLGFLFLAIFLLPGINAVLIIALPLTGVLENWIRMRK